MKKLREYLKDAKDFIPGSKAKIIPLYESRTAEFEDLWKILLDGANSEFLELLSKNVLYLQWDIFYTLNYDVPEKDMELYVRLYHNEEGKKIPCLKVELILQRPSF